MARVLYILARTEKVKELGIEKVQHILFDTEKEYADYIVKNAFEPGTSLEYLGQGVVYSKLEE